MVKISFQIFDLMLRNFISFFWDFNGGSFRKQHLQMLVLKSKEKRWNDECACPLTLLKLESTTDIGQVHKFQNSDFKEYPWKAATGLQKSVYFKNVLWNTECIDLCFQFPKYRLVRCFKLFLLHQAYVQGCKWKKLLIDWNEYQENTTTIGFKFLSPKLSRESCFTLCWTI